MPLSIAAPDLISPAAHASDDVAALSRLEGRLGPLLSVIAGMVDLTGYFTLGNIFTAHVTGNLVIVAAEAVRGGPVHWAQTLAIPVFMFALAAVWFLGRAYAHDRFQLARQLLIVQFLLLLGLLVFSIITKPSAHQHGLIAGIAAMVAVSAMACQYAVFRLALPGAISTAVMTGNLANAVLSLMDALSPSRPSMARDNSRFKRSLWLLGGFVLGCALAAAAISLLGEGAWLVPTVLSGMVITLPLGSRRR